MVLRGPRLASRGELQSQNALFLTVAGWIPVELCSLHLARSFEPASGSSSLMDLSGRSRWTLMSGVPL
jgi:hypothetical protein